MPYSYVAYTGNGATTQFAVPFGYIRREHVFVNINQVSQSYTWVNDSTVQLAAAPANGILVEVRRSTPAASPLVDFSDGSTLVAADLDTSNLQLLYLEQELLDNQQQTVSVDPATGLPSLSGSRLTNVGNPVSAQDATTKTYVDTADALKLNKAGDIMTGALAMGGNKVTNLGNGTVSTDAVTKGQFDAGIASVAVDAAAASASAAAAASSASDANNYKNAAQSAQTAAEAARDQTLAAYDSFDDRYLGTKTSNPTLDNDGNALVAGALYFNSVAGEMRLYTGSVWVSAYVSGTATNVGFTPTGGIAATNVQTAIAELDTEKLNVGTASSTYMPLANGTFTGDVNNSSTGYFDLPVGTTAQRPGSPNSGMVRFNTDINQYEGYNGTAWASIGGGATGGGADTVFIENSNTVTTSYTLSTNKNAVSAGPVSIGAGATVTVPSGASWVVV